MTSTFFECEFPRTIGYRAMGGPGFNTTVNEGFSGYEQRNQNWQTARGKWTVNLTTPSPTFITSPKEYVEQLNAFFLVVAGKARGFRLFDHKDFTNGVSPQSLGVADGTTSQFQMTKYYNVGSSGYLRKIWKPITSLVVDYQNIALEDSISVFANASVLPHSAGYAAGGSEKYTVDETQGIVDFNAYQNFTFTQATKNSDGTCTYAYSGVTGATVLPTKNSYVKIVAISGWSMNNTGTFSIVSASATSITVYNPSGSTSGFSANAATGVITKSNIVLTGCTATNGRFSYSSYTGQAPAVGMRVTTTGFTNSNNNGTFYVTSLAGGAGTFDTAGGLTNETHAGIGYSDWVPANNVILTDTFKYHYPVRFDTDELAIQIEDSNTLGEAPIVTWQSIVLRELRLATATQG